MESTETIQHAIRPLKDGWFIDEVGLSHTVGKDFWLGKAESDDRIWLANDWETALRLSSKYTR